MILGNSTVLLAFTIMMVVWSGGPLTPAGIARPVRQWLKPCPRKATVRSGKQTSTYVVVYRFYVKKTSFHRTNYRKSLRLGEVLPASPGPNLEKFTFLN